MHDSFDLQHLSDVALTNYVINTSAAAAEVQYKGH